MAIPDKTIDPKILESARTEFLSKGYMKASLKTICFNAGVTTGALYKRYKGKDELFCAVVKQTVDDLSKIADEKESVELSKMSNQELVDKWYVDEVFMMWWFDYLYQRYDDIVLLIKFSAGSSYSNFANAWGEKMNQLTYIFYEETYRRGIAKKYVDREEMQILISTFWNCIFEPFIHGMKWEQIKEHCLILCRFMNWQRAFEFVTDK